MSMELISMIGGSLLGFVFRLISSLQESQSKALEMSIKSQQHADASFDGAGARGSVLMRRVLIGTILFATVLAPFFLGIFSLPIWVHEDPAGWDVLGVFTGGWTELRGFIILPEVRAGLLGAIGYLLGAAAVGRR